MPVAQQVCPGLPQGGGVPLSIPGEPASPPLRQKPAMHVSPVVVHDGPMVQHARFRAPQVTAAIWQVPAVHV